jgi:hypothetical protein
MLIAQLPLYHVAYTAGAFVRIFLIFIFKIFCNIITRFNSINIYSGNAEKISTTYHPTRTILIWRSLQAHQNNKGSLG